MSSLGARFFVPKEIRRNNYKQRLKKVSLYYQNVRGLRSKTRFFYNNVSHSEYDILALTETFLTSSVSDGELFPPGYTVIRKDRQGDAGWGGVLLAVRDCFLVREIIEIDGLTLDKELIFAIVNWKNVKFLCCVVYLPPSYDDVLYLNVLTCIESAICAYSNMHVILIGDFNLNSCSSYVKTQFSYFSDFCNLQQHNKILNIHGGMLDLVLSDYDVDRFKVSEGLDPLVPIDNYHPSLDVTFKIPCGAVPARCARSVRFSNTSPDWNWRKADFVGLYSAIADLDWSDLMTETDVDLAVETFYSRLSEVISLFVPKKILLPQSQQHVYPKWFSTEIISNIKYKYYHLKRYKIEGKEFNRELFRYYRWKVKILIDNAYKQHIKLVQGSIFSEPAQFWEYVKDRRKDRRGINVYCHNGIEVTGQAAANAFAQYFGSVFQDEEPLLNYTEAVRAAHTLGDSSAISVGVVHETDLKVAFKRLKPRAAGGPDCIPAFLVKDCASLLSSPLLFLFNLSLTQRKYPECWKLSRVIPVPKGDSGRDVSAFRPIAVLSVVAKLFETVLNLSISKQICNALHADQHGFRRGRSTNTNLVAHVDYIYAEMDAKRQVDAAYFDFRKAFDVVDNDILLCKLAILGFTPNLLKFFASYLGNRRQFVKVDGFESNHYRTRSGVSQGSTLGPTLFLIFINDLPEKVKSAKCLLFADDLKLSLGIGEEADTLALQKDIDAVTEWSRDNRLPFNESKCKVITFSLKLNPIKVVYKLYDAPLDRVNDIRDLGLILDTKLDFHKHVTLICKQASRLLGFVMRTAADFDDVRVTRVIYNAYVRSKLEYAAVVWNPYEDKYEMLIERIQRKFARWLYKKSRGYYPYLYPSLFVLGMVTLETLKLRRVMAAIVHYLSIVHHALDAQEVVERMGLLVPRYLPCDQAGTVAPRRRPRLLHRPATRTKRAALAPTNRALRLIGDILARHDDIDLFADSFSSLRHKFQVIVDDMLIHGEKVL